MKIHIFELRNEELNVKKILAVTNNCCIKKINCKSGEKLDHQCLFTYLFGYLFIYLFKANTQSATNGSDIARNIHE